MQAASLARIKDGPAIKDVNLYLTLKYRVNIFFKVQEA
jgi:hypothetical protein